MTIPLLLPAIWASSQTDYEAEVDLKKLEEAKARLTKVHAYTKFWNENPSSVGISKPEEVKTVNSILDKYYAGRVGSSLIRSDHYSAYLDDITLVQTYIGQQAFLQKDEIIKKRKKLIEEIKVLYQSYDKVESLILSLAVMLCYRCGLPYMQSIETSNKSFPEVEDENAPPGYLPLAESPNTLEELREHQTKYSWASTLFIAVLMNAYKSVTAKPWHEWSGYVGEHDPYGSPYVERFNVIKHIFNKSYLDTEATRKLIYQEHPICMVLHNVASPFELADIVRESHSMVRKEKIADLMKSVAEQIEIANNELEKDFKKTRDSEDALPNIYNWAKYRPLLINVSFNVHQENNTQLKYLCEKVILPNMYGESPKAQFESALSYGSILLALASFGSGSVLLRTAVVYTLTFLDGIDFLISLSDLVKSYMTDPRQARAKLLEKFDKELVAYEKNDSPEAATTAFLLTLFFLIPDYLPSGNVPKKTLPGMADDLASPTTAKASSSGRTAPGHTDVPHFPPTGRAAVEAPPGSSKKAPLKKPINKPINKTKAEPSPRMIEDNGLTKRFDDDPLIVTAPETRTTVYDLKAVDRSPVAKPKTAAKKPKVLGSRYAVKTQADLDALKAVVPQKPASMNADDELLWQQYIDYYNKRLEKIQTQLSKGIPIGDPPRTWESYQSVMERYGKPGFSNLSQVDIDRMRHNVPQKPVNLNTEEEEIWNKYLEYYYKQLDKIEEELKTGVSSSSVQKWGPYLNREKNRIRGAKHEGVVGRGKSELEEAGFKFGDQVVLSEKPNAGTSKGERTKPDHIIVDEETGIVTSVSDKSRQLLDVLDEFSVDEWKKIKQKVTADVEEAYYKYSGQRYFQSPDFSDLTKSEPVNIQEIVLIYDYDPKLLNREVAEFAKASADEAIIALNKKHNTNVELIVTFQYE